MGPFLLHNYCTACHRLALRAGTRSSARPERPRPRPCGRATALLRQRGRGGRGVGRGRGGRGEALELWRRWSVGRWKELAPQQRMSRDARAGAGRRRQWRRRRERRAPQCWRRRGAVEAASRAIQAPQPARRRRDKPPVRRAAAACQPAVAARSIRRDRAH